MEALHGWILKFGEDSKKLCISVEIFVEWLANGNTSWASYYEFMSDHLITLDKQTGALPVSVRETWIHLFSKCVVKVTGPEATN